MKKSIIVGRKFTKLSVILVVCLQVLCVACKADDTDRDDSYVVQQVGQYKEEIARDMLSKARLDKISEALELSPLNIKDMVPETDGAVEFDKQESKKIMDVESGHYRSSKARAVKKMSNNES